MDSPGFDFWVHFMCLTESRFACHFWMPSNGEGGQKKLAWSIWPKIFFCPKEKHRGKKVFLQTRLKIDWGLGTFWKNSKIHKWLGKTVVENLIFGGEGLQMLGLPRPP